MRVFPDERVLLFSVLAQVKRGMLDGVEAIMTMFMLVLVLVLVLVVMLMGVLVVVLVVAHRWASFTCRWSGGRLQPMLADPLSLRGRRRERRYDRR
jgi:hypothetical protein